MNFGEDENFFIRHRYFFLNYSFKFRGMNATSQKSIEDIVKQLSATVSTYADYTLVEESYFQRQENKDRTDLYSINYILDSIVAKEPLNIDKYRFIPTKLHRSTSPCCLVAKYVLQTNSCLRYYHDNVRCQECTKEDIVNSIGMNNLGFPDFSRKYDTLDNLTLHTIQKDAIETTKHHSNSSSEEVALKKNSQNKKRILPCSNNNISEVPSQKKIVNVLKRILYSQGNWRMSSASSDDDICEKERKGATENNSSLSCEVVATSKKNFNGSKKIINSQRKRRISLSSSDDDICDKERKGATESNSSLSCEVVATSKKNFNGSKKIINSQRKRRISLSSSDDDICDKERKKTMKTTEEQSSCSSDEVSAKRRKKNEVKISTLSSSGSDSIYETNKQDSTDSNNEISSSSCEIVETYHKKVIGLKRRIYCRGKWKISSSSRDNDNCEKNKKNTTETSGEESSSSSEVQPTKKKRTYNELELLSLPMDDETSDSRRKPWWLHLPKVTKAKPSEVKETLYNKGHRRRGSDYTLNETRIMIAYLITKKKINAGLGRAAWREMLVDGYLKHRSVESLSNHFRKIILSKIHNYGLPKHIVKQFLALKQIPI